MARRNHKTQDRAAAREETQEEARDASGVVYTKETARGFVVAVPLFALLGAVLAAPFGFIDFGEISLVTRIVSAAIVGAFAGAVIGFVVGPSVAARQKAKRTPTSAAGARSRPGEAEKAEATGRPERSRKR